MNNERIPEVQDFLDNAAYMTAPQPDQGQLTHIREDAVQCFNFGDNGVRVITRDGEPWFVASDVCKILDLGNVTMTLDRLDKVNINSIEVPNSLGHQRLTQIINEKGLYRLIFTSRKPDALAFQDWVYDTVLPTVRKTGGYMTPALTAAALDDPSALLSLWNASMRHLQVALDKNKELQPAAEYVERIMDSPRPRRAGFSNPELRWSGPRNDAGKRARTSATRPSRDASGARFSFLQPDNALTLFFQRFPVFI